MIAKESIRAWCLWKTPKTFGGSALASFVAQWLAIRHEFAGHEKRHVLLPPVLPLCFFDRDNPFLSNGQQLSRALRDASWQFLTDTKEETDRSTAEGGGKDVTRATSSISKHLVAGHKVGKHGKCAEPATTNGRFDESSVALVAALVKQVMMLRSNLCEVCYVDRCIDTGPSNANRMCSHPKNSPPASNSSHPLSEFLRCPSSVLTLSESSPCEVLPSSQTRSISLLAPVTCIMPTSSIPLILSSITRRTPSSNASQPAVNMGNKRPASAEPPLRSL